MRRSPTFVESGRPHLERAIANSRVLDPLLTSLERACFAVHVARLRALHLRIVKLRAPAQKRSKIDGTRAR
jgi:hypothetical protein